MIPIVHVTRRKVGSSSGARTIQRVELEFEDGERVEIGCTRIAVVDLPSDLTTVTLEGFWPVEHHEGDAHAA